MLNHSNHRDTTLEAINALVGRNQTAGQAIGQRDAAAAGFALKFANIALPLNGSRERQDERNTFLSQAVSLYKSAAAVGKERDLSTVFSALAHGSASSPRFMAAGIVAAGRGARPLK